MLPTSGSFKCPGSPEPILGEEPKSLQLGPALLSWGSVFNSPLTGTHVAMWLGESLQIHTACPQIPKAAVAQRSAIH